MQRLLQEEGLFSEVIYAVCSWDCSHSNNVFVMAEGEKREGWGMGDRKKDINKHLKGEKRASRAS